MVTQLYKCIMFADRKYGYEVKLAIGDTFLKYNIWFKDKFAVIIIDIVAKLCFI